MLNIDTKAFDFEIELCVFYNLKNTNLLKANDYFTIPLPYILSLVNFEIISKKIIEIKAPFILN